MKSRLRILTIIAIVILFGASCMSRQHTFAEKNYQGYLQYLEVLHVNTMDMFKEIVLLKCLRYGYQDTVNLAKDYSMSVYMDLTNYAPTTYGVGESLDSLAIDFVSRLQPSHIDDYDEQKLIFFQTMQYYTGGDMEKEIVRILRRAANDWAEEEINRNRERQ